MCLCVLVCNYLSPVQGLRPPQPATGPQELSAAWWLQIKNITCRTNVGTDTASFKCLVVCVAFLFNLIAED